MYDTFDRRCGFDTRQIRDQRGNDIIHLRNKWKGGAHIWKVHILKFPNKAVWHWMMD
jgi:hypothetical protein